MADLLMVEAVYTALGAVARDARANKLVMTLEGARARARFNLAARVLIEQERVEAAERAVRAARSAAQFLVADSTRTSCKMALSIAEGAFANSIAPRTSVALTLPGAELTEDERKTLAVAKAPGAPVLPFRPRAERPDGLRTSDGLVG